MQSQIPAANLETILASNFQNTKRTTSQDEINVISYSRLILTDNQIACLHLPEGFRASDFYLYAQSDYYQKAELTSCHQYLVVFALAGSYVYTLYFDIKCQSRFDICLLVKACQAIRLDCEAKLTYSDYLEVNFAIDCGCDTRPLALGLSKCGFNTVQQSDSTKLQIVDLTSKGLEAKATCPRGLSENIKAWICTNCTNSDLTNH